MDFDRIVELHGTHCTSGSKTQAYTDGTLMQICLAVRFSCSHSREMLL